MIIMAQLEKLENYTLEEIPPYVAGYQIGQVKYSVKNGGKETNYTKSILIDDVIILKKLLEGKTIIQPEKGEDLEIKLSRLAREQLVNIDSNGRVTISRNAILASYTLYPRLKL